MPLYQIMQLLWYRLFAFSRWDRNRRKHGSSSSISLETTHSRSEARVRDVDRSARDHQRASICPERAFQFACIEWSTSTVGPHRSTLYREGVETNGSHCQILSNAKNESEKLASVHVRYPSWSVSNSTWDHEQLRWPSAYLEWNRILSHLHRQSYRTMHEDDRLFQTGRSSYVWGTVQPSEIFD